MKTKASIGIVGIAVFLVLVGAVSAVDAIAGTTVSVEPATQTVKSGDSFSVDIDVTYVTYMGMDQAVLNFDPSAMQATGIVEGAFLKSAGATLAIALIDNDAGTASFTYALMAPSVGVTGSGTLATINFDSNASAECTFDLTLTDVALADGDGDPIIVDEIINGEVKIDNTTPTVDITSPADGHWFDSEDVVITFHPWDNKDQLLNYSVYVDDEEVKNGTAPNCSVTEVNLGEIDECNHVIRVNVTDDVGFEGSDEITIHVDRTPPTVEIISPDEDEWFDSEPVIVEFHPWDNKADVLNYTIYVDDIEVDNGTAYNCTSTYVDLGILPECDHVINVTVEDYAGKTNSSEVTIHVDLYPPTVDIISPEQGLIYPNLCARLNFTAADPGVCPSGINWTAYSLDGGANVTITEKTIIEITAPCDHTLIVYAKDEVGKENSSAVTFTLWPGDVYDQSGQTGKVNGFDLQRLAWAFLSEPGDNNWNERADLKCDNKIDGFDLQRLAWNFMNDYTQICVY